MGRKIHSYKQIILLSDLFTLTPWLLSDITPWLLSDTG